VGAEYSSALVKRFVDGVEDVVEVDSFTEWLNCLNTFRIGDGSSTRCWRNPSSQLGPVIGTRQAIHPGTRTRMLGGAALHIALAAASAGLPGT